MQKKRASVCPQLKRNKKLNDKQLNENGAIEGKMSFFFYDVKIELCLLLIYEINKANIVCEYRLCLWHSSTHLSLLTHFISILFFLPDSLSYAIFFALYLPFSAIFSFSSIILTFFSIQFSIFPSSPSFTLFSTLHPLSLSLFISFYLSFYISYSLPLSFRSLTIFLFIPLPSLAFSFTPCFTFLFFMPFF